MAKRDVKAASGTRAVPKTGASPKRPKKARRLNEARDLYRRLDDIRANDDGPLEKYDQRKIATESWRKRTRIHDVERAQSQHSPTIDLTVDYPEGRNRVRKNPTRVRQSEAWRHSRLNGMQRQAETEMEFAWTVRTAGMGAAVSNYGRPRGSAGGRLDTFADVERAWRDWTAEALIKKIHINAVIDCLAEPRTLPDIERAYKFKTGEALSNYQRGLDLWCELRGWLRPNRGLDVDKESTVAP